MSNENYKVEIEKAVGSCDSNLFKKMASNGDVNAVSITTLIDKVVTVSGYAKIHVQTKDKDFETYYIATYDGLYFSGINFPSDNVIGLQKKNVPITGKTI